MALLVDIFKRFSFLTSTLIALIVAPALLAQTADITVFKTGPSEAAADSDVTYTISVVNLGPDAAGSVVLNDPLPAGMTFVSSTQDSGPLAVCSTPAVGDPGSINCTFAAFPSGDTAEFTFVAHIPSGTPDGTVFTNIATVMEQTDPDSENDSSTAVTIVPAPPSSDLSVQKTGPTSAGPGTDVVYTILLTNSGAGDATNVSLTDTLPGTMTFVSLSQESGPTLICTTPTAGTGGTISCTAATFGAGATATFTLTGNVPAGEPTGTVFTNTATVSASNDPADENNTSTTTLNISTADLAVTKTGPTGVVAGNTVSYVITVTNGGPDLADNVQLNDVLPGGTTFVSMTQNSGTPATCSTPDPGENGTVSCGLGNLLNGATSQFTLVVTAGNIPSITNTATVAADSFDTNTPNNSASVTTAVTPSADLSVVKSGPGTATAGDDVTYTITAANNGPSDATSVSLMDAVPAGTTFVSFVQNDGPLFSCATPASGGTGTITCTIATLAPGATASFTMVVHLNAAATGSLVNTATIESSTGDPSSINDSSSSTATIATSADVSVVKSGPAAASAGTNVTYTVTVTNNGPSDAANVSLTDSVPAETTFVSATPACTTPAAGGTGTITCAIGTLTSGATAIYTFVVHVDPDAVGPIVNTANVSATTADPSSPNNSSTATTTIGALADLAVTKSGPAAATAGDDLTYTVTVTNNGPSDAQAVTLTDTVPAQTTFVSATPTCSTPATGGTGTITCTIGTLTPGAAATYTFVVHVDPAASGSINNTATAATTAADPNPANDSASVSTVLSPGPTDLRITKVANGNRFSLGSPVTYTITVTNEGPGLAAGVTVTDTIPAGSTFVSATPSQGTCTGTTTVVCSLGTLTPAASATISLVVQLPATQGPLANTATVTAINAETNPPNNASTSTIQIVASQDIPTASPLALAILALTLAAAGWFAQRR